MVDYRKPTNVDTTAIEADIATNTANIATNTSNIATNTANLHYPQAIGKFEYVNGTQAQLVQKNHTHLLVNGELVDISAGKIVTFGVAGDNKLNADGTDSGVKTTFAGDDWHVYISNSLASWAPLTVKPADIAPTNGYLATTGNGANWRHVGYLLTGSTTLVADSTISYGLNRFSKRLTADVTRSTGGAAWVKPINLGTLPVMPGGWLSAHAILNTKHDANLTRMLRITEIVGYSPTLLNEIGGVGAYVPANQEHSLVFSFKTEEETTFRPHTIDIYFYYPGSGTFEILHDNINTTDGRGAVLEVQIFNPWH